MASELELKMLDLSVTRGMWAFSTQPVVQIAQPFVSDSLIAVDVPPWMARTWCITLGSFKYARGPIPIVGQPPDNQTQANQTLRARVQWGVQGSYDIAVVDYFARGCCFQVQAASIRVSLFSEGGFTNALAVPTLSGFVTPYPRFAVVDVAPTFTAGISIIAAAGGTRLIPIPSRATAYRWFISQGAPGPGQVSLDQVQENGASTVQFDASIPQAAPDPEQLQGNRQGYMPLNNLAQFVRIVNNDPAQSVTMGVSFLLDLG
jgi:hypothetical protein